MDTCRRESDRSRTAQESWELPSSGTGCFLRRCGFANYCQPKAPSLRPSGTRRETKRRSIPEALLEARPNVATSPSGTGRLVVTWHESDDTGRARFAGGSFTDGGTPTVVKTVADARRCAEQYGSDADPIVHA